MPIMPQYRSPYGSSIIDLLSHQGDAQARAAEQQGLIWGRAVQNIGNIGAEAYQQHAEQKQQKQRESMFNEAISTWDGQDIPSLYRKLAVVVGPVEAAKQASAIGSIWKVQQGKEPDENDLKMAVLGINSARKAYGDEHMAQNWQSQYAPSLQKFGQKWGWPVPPAWDSKVGDFFANAENALTSKKDGVTPQEAYLSEPDPTKRQEMIARQAEWAGAGRAPVEPKVDSRSLDARYAEAVATGNMPEAQKLLQAKARLEAAGRAPVGAGSKMWVVRNGQTIRIGENEYQPGDQPTGMRERPSTGVERRVLSFYIRAQEASDNIMPLEDTVRKLNTAEQAQLQWAPNLLQTTDNQLYRQAQRAFTEARLRKDSGATIKKDEYESDAKTYFAQPGDSDEVLEQKRRGRAKILESLKAESGRAYGEHFGEDPGQQEEKPDPLGLRRPK